MRNRIKQERFASPAQEAFLNLLVAADHLQTMAQTICEAHGLTRGQYNVLRILKGVYPAGHPRCEIAVRMIERAPDITRLVDRLEKQGLVERGRGDEDRRQSVTRVTRKGIQLLERLNPQLEDGHKDIADRLTATDCRTLSELCGRIYATPE
ncbi:MAG: MarR family transcriptional regulator [Pyrinomonadaceae bacterium]